MGIFSLPTIWHFCHLLFVGLIFSLSAAQFQITVTNPVDSAANASYCIPASIDCNLRSAWQACIEQSLASSTTCDIILPSEGLLLMNNLYGSLKLNISSVNITIYGDGAKIAPDSASLEWDKPLFDIEGPALDLPQIGYLYFAAENISFYNFDGSSIFGTVLSAKGLFDISLSSILLSGIRSYAGAIFAQGHDNGLVTPSKITVGDSLFLQSAAIASGAALFLENNIQGEIYTSQFMDLYAGNGSAITGANLYQSLVITDQTVFINCSASIFGGAVYIEGALMQDNLNVFLQNSAFSGCFSQEGGAIYANNLVSLVADNVSIEKSAAEFAGGGIFVQVFNQFTIVNSLFFETGSIEGPGGAVVAFLSNQNGGLLVQNSRFLNADSLDGGGIFAESVGWVEIDGCEFYKNAASGNGGAIDTYSAKAVTVTGSTFTNCSAGSGNGGSVRISYASTVDMSHCDFNHSSGYLAGSTMNIDFSFNITLSNLNILDSTTSSIGTMFLYDVQNALVANCMFLRNSGGALSVGALSSNVIVVNSTFIDSSTLLYGSAVYITETTNIIFDQCIFQGNHAGLMGGAFYVNADVTNLRLVQCVFEDNSALSGEGGAVYIDTGVSEVVVAGSIFTNNYSPTNGGAIYLNDGNTVIVVMSYDNYDSYTVVQSPHPYVSQHPVNGVPYTITNQTVESKSATGFLIYFSPETSIWNTDTVNIYVISNSGEKILYFSGNSNFPGVDAPALLVSGSSVIIELMGPPDDKFYLQNEFGFIAYVIPVTKHSQFPSRFISNTAGQSGGAMYFLFDHQFPVITNTHFDYNKAIAGGGGGIFFQLANYGLTMWEVHLKGNYATSGGSLVLGNGHFGVTMHKCYFSDSVASINGGAVSIVSGNGNGIFRSKQYNSVNISHSDFNNNTAMGTGGGVMLLDVGNIVEVIKTTFSNNSALSRGGVIVTNENNQMSFSKVEFEGNMAHHSSGGAISSEKTNQFFFQHTSFVANSAGAGGGALSIEGSSVTFCSNNTFRGNAASNGGGAVYLSNTPFWYGGYYCLFSNKKEKSSPKLTFFNNKSPRGSAVLLYEVTFGPTNQVNMVPSTFESNVAAVGGTVYWIKDGKVMITEPPGLSDTTALQFYGNIAAYGNRSATQAVQTILPTQYEVTVYTQSLKPPIDVRIADYYGQMIPVNGTSTVYASVVDSGPANCSGYFPYLSGHNLAGSGVPFEKGVASFSSLSAYCAPTGKVSVQFEVRLGSETTLSPQTLEKFYITNTSTFVFRSCNVGEYSHQGNCISCPSGSYNLDTINAESCISCIGKSGVLTCYSDNMILLSRFWRRYPTNQAVLPCTMINNCVGGNLTGDASCAAGYEGPLCGVCQPGYYLSNNLCQACGTADNLSPGLVASIIFIAVIIGLIFACSFYKYVYVPDALDVTSENVELSTVQLLYLWGKMKFYSFIVKIKIIAANVQILSSADTTFKVHMPVAFSHFSSGIGVINLNFAGLVSFGCSISHYNFFGRLLLATLTPIVILTVFVIAYVIQYIIETVEYRRGGIHTSERDNQFQDKLWSLKNTYITYLFGITYLILPMVTTTIFQTFLCTNIDPQHENPTEPSLYLTADLSISCESPGYYHWRIYAILMIFVYPIGIPALYFSLLFLNRDEIMHRDDEEALEGGVRSRKLSSGSFDYTQEPISEKSNGSGGEITSGKNPMARNKSKDNGESIRSMSTESSLAKRAISPHVARLSFLWLAYQPKYWYWEIVETTRRLLLTAGLSVISPGSSGQTVLGVMLAFAYVKLYGYFKPYKAARDDSIAEVGLMAVFTTFFIALVVQNGLLSNEYDIPLGVLLIIASVAIFVSTIWFGVLEYQQDVLSLTGDEYMLASKLFGRFSFLCAPFGFCCPISGSSSGKNVFTLADLPPESTIAANGNIKVPSQSSANTLQLKTKQKYRLDGEVAATNRFRKALLLRQRQQRKQIQYGGEESNPARVVTVTSPIIATGTANAATARRKRTTSSHSPSTTPITSPNAPTSRKTSTNSLRPRSTSSHHANNANANDTPDIEMANCPSSDADEKA